jgi:Ca2+-binding EF-hand superfamily protein
MTPQVIDSFFLNYTQTTTLLQVKSAFKLFEGVNPSGYVRAEALIRALCVYGKDKLTEEQAAELVGQLEVDASGLVNYNDYVNMMMST